MFIHGCVVLALLTTAQAPSAAKPPSPGFEDGFESAEVGKLPEGWRVPTEGFQAVVAEGDAGDGHRSVVLRSVEDKGAPFGNFVRRFDAAPYAGQRVVLTAKVRAECEGRGWAQMWLRVDRPESKEGAFDNMGDRPILPGSEWRSVSIVADVDADALVLNIGFMSLGKATVHVDSVRLEGKGAPAAPKPAIPPRAATARGLENLEAATRLLGYVRFFDPSDQAAGVQAWDHFAAALFTSVEDAGDARELAERLSRTFAPVAPALQVWAGAPEAAPPEPAVPGVNGPIDGWKSWRHNGAGAVGTGGGGAYFSARISEGLEAVPASRDAPPRSVVKSLGGGVCCRIPLRAPFDAGGTLPHGKTPEEWSSADVVPKLTALDRSTRFAGVAIAWNVFQHFYPYFDVVETDWNAALAVALRGAAEDADELAYLRTLRELVAKLHDGHGYVMKQGLETPNVLPIALVCSGSEFVVAGKGASAPADVAVGDVLVAIGGKPIEACCSELAPRLCAATEGRLRYLLARSLVWELGTSDPTPLTLRHPDGREYRASLPFEHQFVKDEVSSKRPGNGAEIAPGIVYFDLNGTDDKALAAVSGKLDAAKGLVFDLRGYPSEAARTVLRHLTREPAQSARWLVPIVTRPDREGWDWDVRGRWDLEPIAPRWNVPVAFLTDASAISQAESILGIVENYALGEIVGSTTAGTNGNVNPFLLPDGYKVYWTGMKVLKHDGSRHHGVGIQPTVPIVPTAAGIAQGLDEVLEAAIQIVQAKLKGGAK